MSYHSFMFRLSAGRTDRKRDRAIELPEGITECRNIAYGEHGKWNRLDVSYPDGTKAPLPTIVSIHGGGYVYGTKEVYRRYCMDLARRGFSVVNFNYRLAPESKFPTPLEDTNAVMEWICRNADTYHLDPKRLFIVGDSAGAQIASQYATIATNPDYATHFDFTIPDITIRAVGLNCGLYDAATLAAGERKSIAKDYLGKHIPADDPRLQVLENITPQFPPAHITTACHDFLRECAKPMAQFLAGKGIKTVMKCYGRDSDTAIGHVFHVNISLPEAMDCNDTQCAFFKEML
jgi:acetyl esterase/lipase